MLLPFSSLTHTQTHPFFVISFANIQLIPHQSYSPVATFFNKLYYPSGLSPRTTHAFSHPPQALFSTARTSFSPILTHLYILFLPAVSPTQPHSLTQRHSPSLTLFLHAVSPTQPHSHILILQSPTHPLTSSPFTLAVHHLPRPRPKSCVPTCLFSLIRYLFCVFCCLSVCVCVLTCC